MALIIASMCSSVAFADANYTDKYYYESYAGPYAWVYSNSRYKGTPSKVYVVSLTAPTGKTRMRTIAYVDGIPTNKTGGNINSPTDYVTIYVSSSEANPSPYGITNRVYEDGDYSYSEKGYRMCLQMSACETGGELYGKWSPDWTGNGSVTIVG